MTDSKSIDHLVVLRIEKEAELATLGRQIQGSGSKTVVMFIDLCDSTKLKAEISAENWLGYVYSFIKTVSDHAQGASGRVVKRIGDELMLAFSNVKQSEDFIARLKGDSTFSGKYRYKVAVDFGDAYHFKFAELGEDDPYGRFVDRCARIAKLAKAGGVLASSDYVKEVSEPHPYVSICEVGMKGFDEPQMVWLRVIYDNSDELAYYRPLLETLNDRGIDRSGYRFVSRQFSPEFFKFDKEQTPRPFLLRELLNVPKLPYSFEEFCPLIRELNNKEDAYDYYGSLVEWRGTYNSCSRQMSWIQAYVYGEERISSAVISLMLVPSMYDIIRTIPKGTRISFRGIIDGISRLNISLNYVDISLDADVVTDTK